MELAGRQRQLVKPKTITTSGERQSPFRRRAVAYFVFASGEAWAQFISDAHGTPTWVEKGTGEDVRPLCPARRRVEFAPRDSEPARYFTL